MPDSGTASVQNRKGERRRPEARNLTRHDWVEGAWEMLGERGIDRVRVEPLAKRLGVTKGSFYWHFKDRDELLEALLDRWFTVHEEDERHVTENTVDMDPGERIWALFDRVIRRVSRGQTVSLRLLSHYDPGIAARIAKEDTGRLEFLKTQLMAMGFAEDDALARGQAYQALMTGEFLRSGALPLEERIDRARRHHEILLARH